MQKFRYSDGVSTGMLVLLGAILALQITGITELSDIKALLASIDAKLGVGYGGGVSNP